MSKTWTSHDPSSWLLPHYNDCVQQCFMPKFRCLTSILTDVFNFVTNSVTQSVTKSVTGPRCSAPLLARDSPFIVEIGH